MSQQNWLQRLLQRKPTQQNAALPSLSETPTLRIDEGMGTTILRPEVLEKRKQAVVTPLISEEVQATVPAVWNVGDMILNQYEVTDILGEGGMGTVYRVHHHGWDIDLAVKCPRPETFATEHGKTNFVREAETWVNLQLHPHIVGCYYVRILGGIPRVFAEYIPGGSLTEWIRELRLYQGKQKQILARILDLAIQFAWGLHAAHEQGLIHQDIKPANVMLTTDEIVKVTDFGLARARVLAGEPATRHGNEIQSVLVSARGMTPAYCSPEQARGEALSRKTDIWSWGVSILEMFTGSVTWRSGTVAAEVLANYDPSDNKDIPPLPEALQSLLKRCFQTAAADRPATMQEVATELQAIYTHEIGIPYPRKMPNTAELVADTLNNRALSLSNLGKFTESQQLWEQALQADPRHLQTTYNKGILLWRQGKLTDDELVKQLEVVRSAYTPQWQASYLLAQVHLERGDRDAAYALLKEAATHAPDATEVQQQYHTLYSQQSHTLIERTLQEDKSIVYAVDISSDGRIAISGGHVTCIWDVTTEKCLHILQPVETFPITHAVSISADGQVALSSRGKYLWLWDTRTGKKLHMLRQQKDVMTAKLSADGNLMISGDGNNAHIWDVQKGRRLHTLKHAQEVQAVTLSVDGNLAVTGTSYANLRESKSTFQIWEVRTGNCLLTIEEAGGTDGVCLSNDNRLLVANLSSMISIWETSTGRRIYRLAEHGHTAKSLGLSGDGRWLVSGSPDHTIRLWDTTTGRCLRTLQQSDWVWSVSISADGKWIIAGVDQFIKVWELDQQRILCSLHPSQALSHTTVTKTKSRAEELLEQFEQAFDRKRYGEALALVREVRALAGWERRPESLAAWKKLTPYCSRTGLRAAWQAKSFQVAASAVQLSSDGQVAVFGSAGSVQIWEIHTGRCLQNLQGHTGNINTICLHEQRQWVASGSNDNTIRLWDISSGQCLRIFQGHTNDVLSVQISTDGHFIVSAGRDGMIRTWDTTTGRCLRVIDGAPGRQGVHRWMYRVSISAHGQLLLTAGQDFTIRIWDLHSGRCLRVIEDHNGIVTSIHVSSDGRYAVSGSSDNTIRVWEVTTGRCLRVIKVNLGLFHDVAMTPEGHWIVSGNAQHQVQLWESSSGRCLCTLQDHSKAVDSVAISANGLRLLSAAFDGTLRLWELDWELEASRSTKG